MRRDDALISASTNINLRLAASLLMKRVFSFEFQFHSVLPVTGLYNIYVFIKVAGENGRWCTTDVLRSIYTAFLIYIDWALSIQQHHRLNWRRLAFWRCGVCVLIYISVYMCVWVLSSNAHAFLIFATLWIDRSLGRILHLNYPICMRVVTFLMTCVRDD